MKTAEELKSLKEEVEALNKKLAELSEEELEQVNGGVVPSKKYFPKKGYGFISPDGGGRDVFSHESN